MTAEALAWALAQRVQTPAERLVLLEAAVGADSRHHIVASVEWLAEWTRLTPDEVREAITALTSRGLILPGLGHPVPEYDYPWRLAVDGGGGG